MSKDAGPFTRMRYEDCLQLLDRGTIRLSDDFKEVYGGPEWLFRPYQERLIGLLSRLSGDKLQQQVVHEIDTLVALHSCSDCVSAWSHNATETEKYEKKLLAYLARISPALNEPKERKKWLANVSRVRQVRREITRQYAKFRGTLVQRDGEECRRCGAKRDLQIDHIMPVSRGGDNALTNLQLLCRSCNIAKGASLPSGAMMEAAC